MEMHITILISVVELILRFVGLSNCSMSVDELTVFIRYVQRDTNMMSQHDNDRGALGCIRMIRVHPHNIPLEIIE